MGPITLFDKSFLQSLSVDESVWFDHFFIANICPLFYVETLADLNKVVRESRTPEQEVGLIAEKFPDMSGSPCSHHDRLCIGSLLGNNVPMTGKQIPLAGGRIVKSDGKSGVVFDQSPESEAFFRWQNHKFLEIERDFASSWRRKLSTLNLNVIKKELQVLGINGNLCKNFEDTKALAETLVKNNSKPDERMKFTFSILNIPFNIQSEIWRRWLSSGFPPLYAHAPYAAHVLTVEIFFQLALAADLISSERLSNRVDIAYLFYLPFCTIFTSSDKLHQKCAPLFLKDDQEFIWGQDFKSGLKEINEYYSHIHNNIKEKGVMGLSSKPPKEGNYFIAQIWDHHFNNWREKNEIDVSNIPTETNTQLVKEIKKMADAPSLDHDEIDFDPTNPDTITLERKIRKKKGSWYQVPKDLR